VLTDEGKNMRGGLVGTNKLEFCTKAIEPGCNICEICGHKNKANEADLVKGDLLIPFPLGITWHWLEDTLSC
jgi:hypothetical protein